VSSSSLDHERATIRAFVLPNKQERFLSFTSNPKSRHKFVRELAHFRHLDPRYIKPIAPRDHTPDAIATLLRSKGAGNKCWVISELERLDGREISLESVLSEVVGYGVGTIVSCISGRLAYFEDEDARCVLEH